MHPPDHGPPNVSGPAEITTSNLIPATSVPTQASDIETLATQHFGTAAKFEEKILLQEREIKRQKEELAVKESQLVKACHLRSYLDLYVG